jgi:hypothetical protein
VLRQLACLDADYTNALLGLIDSRTVRVCEIVLVRISWLVAFYITESPGVATQGDTMTHYPELLCEEFP